ncbi:MAG: SpoIIE family protein phosphatase [Clostridiales bacterium]|nr:SpoIIE family protein phosphatase [Clostridiales bacterium]
MKKSIKLRIMGIISAISLSGLLFLGVFSIIGAFNMRDSAIGNINELSQEMSEETFSIYRAHAIDTLRTVAEQCVALVDSELQKVQRQSETVAKSASYIYSHEKEYAPAPLTNWQDALDASENVRYSLSPEGGEDAREELLLMGNIRGALIPVLKENSPIIASYIGTEKGSFIAVDSDPAAAAPLRGYDPRARYWYEGAKKSGAAYWSEIVNYSDGYGAEITCSVPIYELRGEEKIFRGVAGTDAMLSEIDGIVRYAEVGAKGYAFLLDSRGQAIINQRSNSNLTARGDGAVTGEDYLNSPNEELRALASEMTSGKSGLRKLKIDEELVYAAYYPLKTLNWSICFVLPVRETEVTKHIMEAQITNLKDGTTRVFDKAINKIMLKFFAVFLLSFCVIIAFSIKFSKTITRPITQLQEGVLRIANGFLDEEINIRAEDEIGTLAASVNKMARSLKDYITEAERAAIIEARERAELKIAGAIQSSMLPRNFSLFPEMYAVMKPAKAVGGDFYDFFMTDDDHLAVLIADVSGKGIPAAMFMVVARTLLKNIAQLGGWSPKRVFEIVNASLCENNDTCMFVTVFMGYLEISTGRFSYVNAGHNPPIIRRGGGEEGGFLARRQEPKNTGQGEWLRSSRPGFVLAGMEDTVYTQEETTLAPGDTLFMYTDGVTEAANGGGELFSEARLMRAFNAGREDAPQKLITGIQAEVERFASGAEQADDITMLALKITERNE